MPTLTLAMQEEKAPVRLPEPAATKSKSKQKKRPSMTQPKASTGADTGTDTGTSASPPKPKRGRKKLLHDEEQRLARRKVQCKLNQRRYRARQRGLITTLTLETEGLTGYIQDLVDYRDFLGKYCRVDEQDAAELKAWDDPRPLLVVEAFLRVFKAGFALQSTETSELQESFVRLVCAPEMVSQGATVDGVGALLLQLKRYSSYHAALELRRKSVRAVHAPTPQMDGQAQEQKLHWIVEAKGSTRLRLSRDTLMLVYPHVLRHHDALVQRIVGQTIEPDFTTLFHFDAHAKVTKLEQCVDFAGAFFKILKSVEDVATVLDGALISPFAELGMDPQGSKAESALTRGSKQLSLKYILL